MRVGWGRAEWGRAEWGRAEWGRAGRGGAGWGRGRVKLKAQTQHTCPKLQILSFRMDVDQAARSNAQEYFGVKDPDYYEFEAHVFIG